MRDRDLVRRAYADERFGLGALVRPGADQVPRGVPRAGAARGVRGLRRDRRPRVRDAAVREGLDHLPALPRARAARLPLPRERAPRARLHGRRPGREAAADPRDRRDRGRRTATRTSSRATASWPRTPSSSRRSSRPAIGFMGPSSRVVRQAGAKDEAKKLARALGNSVIPGVDTVSARALLARARRTARALERSRAEHGLAFAWDGCARARGQRRGAAPGRLREARRAGHDRGAPGAGRARVPRDLARVPEPPDPLQAHRRRRRKGPARGRAPGAGARPR